ncbi:MAG: glycosyltransferase family 39 protein [Armatimonadota bacterium]|nr:glycosyltransferase family 39 protein [Armatimonadota bacterium]
MRTWTWLLWAAGALVLAAAPLPHVDGDAALYGRIAKNVLRSGDWLTLRFTQDWVVDKPPLTIWFIAASLRVAGQSDAALRGWQLLMTLGLAVVTYRLARLHANREEALLAALVLLTAVQVLYQSLTPQQDVALSFFLALAHLAYLAYRHDGRVRSAAAAGLWLALAVLAKGVVAVAIFAMTAGGEWLLARRAGEVRGWPWRAAAVGAVVLVLVGAPWFVVGLLRQGQPFAEAFFLGGNLGPGRFFSPRISALPPLWQAVLAYVPVLLVGFLPWTPLVPGALRAGWRGVRGGPPSVRLCAIWAAGVFLLLSVSATDKVFRYLHPIYPPLAVLTARAVTSTWDAPRALRGAAWGGVLVAAPALALTAAWLAGRFPDEAGLYLPIVAPFALALAGALVLFAVLALAGRPRTAVALLAGGALVAWGLAERGLAVHWPRLWPWRQIGATITHLMQPGDRVVVFRGAALNFPEYVLDVDVEHTEDAATLGRWWTLEPAVVFLRVRDLDQLPPQPRVHTVLTTPAGWAVVTNRSPRR